MENADNAVGESYPVSSLDPQHLMGSSSVGVQSGRAQKLRILRSSAAALAAIREPEGLSTFGAEISACAHVGSGLVQAATVRLRARGF